MASLASDPGLTLCKCFICSLCTVTCHGDTDYGVKVNSLTGDPGNGLLVSGGSVSATGARCGGACCWSGTICISLLTGLQAAPALRSGQLCSSSHVQEASHCMGLSPRCLQPLTLGALDED